MLKIKPADTIRRYKSVTTLKILVIIAILTSIFVASVCAWEISTLSYVFGISRFSELVSILDPLANIGTHFTILIMRTAKLNRITGTIEI